MLKYSMLQLRTVSSILFGSLSFFEGTHDLPFEIKRVYYIYGVPEGTQRGGHAHKSLSQLLFCPYGKVLLKLDNGTNKADVLLDAPDKGLLVTPGLWRDMLWLQDNSVLCVAASDYYDESDYIRDYSEFVSIYGGDHEG